MKKVLAIVLLGVGFASQVESSSNNEERPFAPCYCYTPSPSSKDDNKNEPAAPTPRNDDNKDDSKK